MKSFTAFTNEQYLAEAYEKGQWVTQQGSDYTAYAVVTDTMKNGGNKAVVFTSYGGSTAGNAAMKSMRNWHPLPKEIDGKDVPPKIHAKIMKKAEKYL